MAQRARLELALAGVDGNGRRPRHPRKGATVDEELDAGRHGIRRLDDDVVKPRLERRGARAGRILEGLRITDL